MERYFVWCFTNLPLIPKNKHEMNTENIFSISFNTSILHLSKYSFCVRWYIKKTFKNLISLFKPNTLNIIVLPGHPLVAQFWVSVDVPEQSCPPLAGLGLVQDRFLDWVPPPHVTEQELHDPYPLHPPLTKSV